jgi:hypothetical protein
MHYIQQISIIFSKWHGGLREDTSFLPLYMPLQFKKIKSYNQMIMQDIWKEKSSHGCDSSISNSQFKDGVHRPRMKCDSDIDDTGIVLTW